MVRTLARQFFSALAWIGLISVLAAAQVTTADIVGRVTDASGATISGARVIIENSATGGTRSALTGNSGDYALNLLWPGRYALRIEATGFKTFVLPELILSAGDRVRVDALMKIGQMEETLEVVANASGLQSDTSTLSAVITDRPVQDLPLSGRNYFELAQLVAGANAGPPSALSSGARPDDRRQTSAISVNGQSDVLNNNLIDGIDNNERIIGTIGVKPSIDAIAEFRVQTSLYSAEVGRTPGGVVNIVTKSGTNAYHGSVYEFFRNDILDARDFFSTTGSKPKYRQNQFGGSIGGPIRKNRTFFFGDYEGLRIVQGITGVSTVPTPPQTRGDFSDLPTPILNPFTGTQFPGNVIPPEWIDPIGAHYAALYPAPTAPGFINNYSGSQNRTQFSSTFDARIDHRFSDDESFFARYSFNDVATFTPGVFPPRDGIEPGGDLFAMSGQAEQTAQNAQLNYIHIFNPRLLMELKAGFARLNNASFPLNYGRNVSSEFGMQGVNLSSETTGLSPIWVVGYSPLGDSGFLPLRNIENNFQYAGSLTHTRGTHNLKMGASLIRRQALNSQQKWGIGFFAFVGLTGNSIADLLLGIPYQTTRQNELAAPGYRTWESGFYIQDDWRAKPWLTLNLGLRYDIFTPFTESHDRISNLDVANARILVAGRNGVSDTAGIKTDYRDVAPRIGFAAMFGPGMVVRGGYGLTFFPTNYTSPFNLKNPPFASSYGPVYFQPLSAGLPLPSPIDPDNPTGALAAQALDYRAAYMQQFNLTVEKEISGNVLRIGYVGQAGRRLAQIFYNINIAPPSPLPNPASRTPFAASLPNVSTIGFSKAAGTSSYNALQLSLERRHKSGLAIGSNYTWAHGIDDVWGLSGEAIFGYGVLPDAVAEVDRGNSDLDVRHRFALTANYEIPAGKSLKGLKQWVLGGWQVNGIAVYQTGLPFTIINAVPQSNTGVDATQSDRPNRVKSGTLPHPSLDRYFDTSAFVQQDFGTLGNSGRNILFAPSFKKVDLSLFKQFDLREPWTLQFRAECYNITNTPGFGAPNTILGDPGFGTISDTNHNYTPRQFQFALKLLF